MALSPAEKSKRWRERQKAERDAKEREAQLKMQADYRKPFGEYAESHGDFSTFECELNLLGYEQPDFTDDRGPKEFAFEEAYRGMEEELFGGKVGSLGRAEYMIQCLLSAAQALSMVVNDYKVREINARITEVEASDLSDVATRKAAMAEIVRLNKILDQLGKQVRRNFQQWKVEGV